MLTAENVMHDMDLETVQGWIKAARPILEEVDAYPLIDDVDALGKDWASDGVADTWMEWYDRPLSITFVEFSTKR